MSKKNNQRPKIINVARNPLTKKLERVHPEDEVPPHSIFQMYWSETLQQYVTILD